MLSQPHSFSPHFYNDFFMAACVKSRPQNRKRQYAEANLSQDILSAQSLKKVKTHHSASRFPPPEFWDSLSKIWLTPRALRELNRRNHPNNGDFTRSPAQSLRDFTGRSRVKNGVYTRARARSFRELPRSNRFQNSTRSPGLATVQASASQFTSRNDLQRFARHGGPELSDLRWYPEPKDINHVHTMSSQRPGRSDRSSHSSYSKHSKSTKPSNSSSSRTSNTSGRRSSAYDADFEQHLIDNAINLNNRKSRPDNAEQMRRRLAQSRQSLSPSNFSDSAFEKFQRKNEDVIDEGEVMRDVLPIVYGNADIPHKENLLFTRFESITNEVTVDAKPDFYDGAPAESLDEQVRKDLANYVVPTLHRTAPVAPNFFLEAKAPKGGADVAKRQACYDGALGARAMHQLQSYGAAKPIYDNNAYTLSTTYHNGNLKIYAIHVTPSGGDCPEYHMTQLGGWDTTGDPDTFRRGAAAFRNGRDMMKEYRDQFISKANERARSTLDSSSYSDPSRTTDAYLGEESHSSAEEPAATPFYAYEQSEFSEDELAGKSSSRRVASGLSYCETSFTYPAATLSSHQLEETKTSDEFATSFSYPSTTSFTYVTSYDDGFSSIQEESEISTDELAKPTLESVPSKRSFKGSGKKHVSKASRTVYQIVPSSSKSTSSSSSQALHSTSQLATSSIHHAAVPSMYQPESTTPEYPSTTTIQYAFPSTITNSLVAGGDGQQDDDNDEYKDDYQIGYDTEIPQVGSSRATSKQPREIINDGRQK